VLEKLKAGYDFATLAKEKSIDPTADSGGFMGRMNLAGLRPELRDALEGLAPGHLSPITRIPSGYAILKVIPESEAEKTENPPRARLEALSAYGNVQYSLSISGLLEAEEALLRFPKVSGWQRDPILTCQMRTQSLAAATERLEKLLAPANREELEQQKPLDLMQEHFALAELYCYAGNMDPAIAQYEEAYRIASEKSPRAVPQMEFALGVAYLHRSEMLNEVYRAPGEKCLFPCGRGMPIEKPQIRKRRSSTFPNTWKKSRKLLMHDGCSIFLMQLWGDIRTVCRQNTASLCRCLPPKKVSVVSWTWRPRRESTLFPWLAA